MKRSILALLVLSCACSTTETRREVMPSAGAASASPGLERVSIQLTVADMPRARADQLFGTDDPSGSDFGPEFTRRLEALVREGAGVDIVHDSKLVLLDGQPGYIEVGTPESYVEHFEIDEDRGIADPVIATLWDGMRFEAQPEIRADGAGVDLDFRLEISTLERPIPESTVELPDLQASVVVQTPSCTNLAERRRIALSPGRVFAFVLHPESDGGAGDHTKVVTLEVEFPAGNSGTCVHLEDSIEIAPR